MAVTKFSQIAASGTNFASATDVLMGVRSGTTDLTWTFAQIAAGLFASPTLTGTVTTPNVTFNTAGTAAAPLIALNDANTGIFSTAHGNISFSSDGLYRVSLTANGVNLMASAGLGLFWSTTNPDGAGQIGITYISSTLLEVNNTNPGTQLDLGVRNLGAGISPLATTFVTIAAGTTAKSQINFAASTAPTSPVDGDFWFDGTNVKIRVSGATKTFTIV